MLVPKISSLVSIASSVYPFCNISPAQNGVFPFLSGGSEKIIHFYTFGDSHSGCATPTLFEKSGNVIWHKHHMGPKLMYSVGRDGLNLLNVKRDVDSYPENSIVLFSFGSIDARRKIHLYQDQGVENVIEDMITKYEKVLLENEEIVPGMHFWVLGLPPPFDKDPRFIENTLRVNELLKEMCVRNSWFFLEIYSDYIDKEGYLDWDFSDTDNHIGAYLPITQERAAKQIKKVREMKESDFIGEIFNYEKK